MKYATILSLATMALGVVAEPPTLVERDLPTITSILSSVGSQIVSVDNQVKAYTSGSAAAVTSAASSLVTTINNGVTTVDGSGNLTLAEAVSLQAPTTDLQTSGVSLVNDLIAKKSAVEANGLCDTVRSEISDLQTASDNLIKAITSKVPAEAQSIAQTLTSGFTGSFMDAVNAFAVGNCTNSGAAASGSPSGSSGTTAGGTPSATSAGSTSSSTGAAAATNIAFSGTFGALAIAAAAFVL